MRITAEEYKSLSNEHAGICLACQTIIHGGVEPDAREHTCEDCNATTVYGLEEALLMGVLEIKESS